MKTVVDRPVVDFHESIAKVLNNVKCSRSFEKSFILTANNFSRRNTCTQDGSFSRRRIESASKIDPGVAGIGFPVTPDSSLVPRPFLCGRGERGEGRKGLVNNSTSTRIHGISFNNR